MDSSPKEPTQPPESPDPFPGSGAEVPFKQVNRLSVPLNLAAIDQEIAQLKQRLNFQIKPAVAGLKEIQQIQRELQDIARQIRLQSSDFTTAQSAVSPIPTPPATSSRRPLFSLNEIVEKQQYLEELARKTQLEQLHKNSNLSD